MIVIQGATRGVPGALSCLRPALNLTNIGVDVRPFTVDCAILMGHQHKVRGGPELRRQKSQNRDTNEQAAASWHWRGRLNDHGFKTHYAIRSNSTGYLWARSTYRRFP